MSNKTIDKRDLVLNQAEEMLINMLRDHMDNGLCAYVYLELTLGGGIEQRHIDYIKQNVLRVDGRFKIKKRKAEGRKSEQYSMNDLLNWLIHFLSASLRDRVLADRSVEIIEKYGTIGYLEGIGYCLKETLLGIKSKYFDKYHSDFEKMIEEYILS